MTEDAHRALSEGDGDASLREEPRRILCDREAVCVSEQEQRQAAGERELSNQRGLTSVRAPAAFGESVARRPPGSCKRIAFASPWNATISACAPTARVDESLNPNSRRDQERARYGLLFWRGGKAHRELHAYNSGAGD